MSYTHEFLFPEYYTDFACKCGDCRATCCHGWGIALSQDEYFRITGREYSPELRRRVDVAFKPATNPAPTPERFALISYNWLGKCPLQNEEGLCCLHRELGEDAIPTICRRYPRCVRVAPIHECCTSTSCEYTLELLYRDDEPVRFVSREIEVYDEEYDTPAAASLDAGEYTSLRELAFAVISDRSLTIDGRIEKLANELDVNLPYFIMSADKAAELYSRVLKSSGSLAELDGDVTAYYADGSKIERFSLDSVPKMDIYLEKMLVNHIFYKAFPRSFEGSTLTDELAALVAVRALHKYVAEAYLGVHGYTLDNFVDVTAKLFRMIEHSRFDEVGARFVQG